MNKLLTEYERNVLRGTFLGESGAKWDEVVDFGAKIGVEWEMRVDF